MTTDTSKSVVVTGASGFLGRHLLAAFEAAGNPTTGISRSAHPDLLQVTNPAALPMADVIVHAGEPGRVDRENAPGHVPLMTDAIDRILELGFPKVVYISSTALYVGGPVPCMYGAPTRDDHPYLQGKMACEDRVLAHGGTVLRLTNLFGRGMSRDNVISTILNQVDKPGPIKVQDAKPVRDFLHVEDAAEAVIRALDVPAGVYDIGTGQGVSIEDIARAAIRSFCHGDKDIVETAPRSAASTIVIDPTAFTEASGWKMRRPLLDALASLLP